MAQRKKTLRKMSPKTREVARLVGELESVAKRLKNRIPTIQSMEFDSQALQTASQPIIQPADNGKVKRAVSELNNLKAAIESEGSGIGKVAAAYVSNKLYVVVKILEPDITFGDTPESAPETPDPKDR